MVEKVTKEALYGKFNNVLTRPGRGGSYQYIKWQDVADRMNDVFGTNWSSSVEWQEVIGSNVVVKVRVMITDPFTKATQYQEGFGGSALDDRQEAGNPFKAAYSKALKDACKKWGIGLFIEEEGDSDGTSNEGGYPQSARPTMTKAPAPNFAPGPQAPPVNNGFVNNTQPTQKPTPAPGGFTPPPAGFTPPPFSGGDTKPNIESMNKATGIMMEGPSLISDVQKAALMGILNLKGVEYTTLVSEAFEANSISKGEVPSIDELTYQEAVAVVKYGNDKFRKRQ